MTQPVVDAVETAGSLKYGGNIWRLFTAQALLMFILWVPIWVVFLQGRGVTLTQIGVLEGLASPCRWSSTTCSCSRTPSASGCRSRRSASSSPACS